MIKLVLVVIANSISFCDENKQQSQASILLVKAKVVSIAQGKDDATTAQLEITHVYYGDSKAKSLSFYDTQRKSRISGNAAFLPFEENEEGIWLLTKKETEYIPTTNSIIPVRNRSRKKENARHDQIILLAETIEKIESAQFAKQKELLFESVYSIVPEISIWSIRKLATYNDSEITRKFDAWTNKDYSLLPVSAQIGLDNIQITKQRDQWVKSNVRKLMINSWVDNKQDEHHGTLILNHINMSEQRQQLESKLAMQLTISAAINTKWDWKNRRNAIFQVGHISKRNSLYEKAFLWYLEQLHNNKDVEVRSAVALSIRNYVILQQSWINKLEEHLKTETDIEVLKTLREAIENSKKKK